MYGDYGGYLWPTQMRKTTSKEKIVFEKGVCSIENKCWELGQSATHLEVQDLVWYREDNLFGTATIENRTICGDRVA